MASKLLGLILSAALAAVAPHVQAAEVKAMVSGGFAAAYKTLTSEHEKRSGDRIETAWGASMGSTPTAVPVRLQRGEAADLVIVAREALDDLAAKGQVVKGSQTDLALSRIAMAVKAGAPAPDIGTVEAFKQALLNARSVAYSDSASGVYIETELFKSLGIADQMKAKSRMIPGTPVGETVARGEAELGFQQLSELMPVAGIRIVGTIPEPLQKVTAFSAGVTTRAKEPEAARALIGFLASPEAHATIKASGMDPAPR